MKITVYIYSSIHLFLTIACFAGNPHFNTKTQASSELLVAMAILQREHTKLAQSLQEKLSVNSPGTEVIPATKSKSKRKRTLRGPALGLGLSALCILTAHSSHTPSFTLAERPQTRFAGLIASLAIPAALRFGFYVVGAAGAFWFGHKMLSFGKVDSLEKTLSKQTKSHSAFVDETLNKLAACTQQINEINSVIIANQQELRTWKQQTTTNIHTLQIQIAEARGNFQTLTKQLSDTHSDLGQMKEQSKRMSEILAKSLSALNNMQQGVTGLLSPRSASRSLFNIPASPSSRSTPSPSAGHRRLGDIFSNILHRTTPQTTSNTASPLTKSTSHPGYNVNPSTDVHSAPMRLGGTPNIQTRSLNSLLPSSYSSSNSSSHSSLHSSSLPPITTGQPSRTPTPEPEQPQDNNPQKKPSPVIRSKSSPELNKVSQKDKNNFFPDRPIDQSY